MPARKFPSQRRTILRVRSWHLDAVCINTDPELFFPNGYAGVEKEKAENAKAICATCPVRQPCLEEALANNDYGVWGGTTEEERDVIKRNLRNETRRRQRAAASQ